MEIKNGANCKDGIDRPSVQYSYDEKLKIVAETFSKPVKVVAQERGVTIGTVYSWISRYKNEVPEVKEAKQDLNSDLLLKTINESCYNALEILAKSVPAQIKKLISEPNAGRQIKGLLDSLRSARALVTEAMRNGKPAAPTEPEKPQSDALPVDSNGISAAVTTLESGLEDWQDDLDDDDDDE